MDDWWRKYLPKTPSELFVYLSGALLLIMAVLVLLFNETYVAGIFQNDYNNAFMDHFNSMMYSLNYPYTRWKVSYPPFITLVYSILGRICEDSAAFVTYGDNLAFKMRNSQFGLVSFVLIFAAILMALFKLVKKSLTDESPLVKTAIPVLLILSYPVLFTLERGNCILATFVLCLFFSLYHDSKNVYLRYAAYVALGMATAMKLTPILLGLMLLRKRDIKEIIICIIICLNIFLIPMLFVDCSLLGLMEHILHASSERNSTAVYLVNIDFWLSAVLGDSQSLHRVAFIIAEVALLIGVVILSLFSKRHHDWEIEIVIYCAITMGLGFSAPYLLGYMAVALVVFFTNEKKLDVASILMVLCFVIILSLFPTPSDLSLRMVSIRSAAMYVLLLLILLRGFLRPVAESDEDVASDASQSGLGECA